MHNDKDNNRHSKKEDLVFFIRVQYRCNSSWQGTIQWMDGKETQVFRSVLELGNLINSTKSVKSGINTESKQWDNKESVS